MMAGARRGGVIVATLLVALLLTVLPMPDWALPYRPPWVAMTLLYWALALPERVGVFSGFALGLLLDVLAGSLLGQHALSLAVIAYLAVTLHQRIRQFPMVQQMLLVWMLLLVERLLYVWLLGATGQPIPGFLYWASAASGALLWPWLFFLLRGLRRRFRVA
ncbi:rod shape-determining protein MreD [Thiococcus pfennigii]|jgi:rod shape-determining protein MreD|uniref:rod shape-determining protein MreD n=1 Tax=Thiococcus pfennigii TaxID=1057 RepID=UPI0019072569|nr:rod shape-determining protein MreD [Thiococcus pfennigii]MBK1733309.1 rod shape-determining protein MreD [Thiococcus pfennigii]